MTIETQQDQSIHKRLGHAPLMKEEKSVSEKSTEPTLDAADLDRRADACLESGDLGPSALPVLEQALARRPRSATLQKGLAAALLVRNADDITRHNPARWADLAEQLLPLMERAFRDFPDSTDLIWRLGALCLLAEHAGEAEARFRQILERANALPEVVAQFVSRIRPHRQLTPDMLFVVGEMVRRTGREAERLGLLEEAVDAGAGLEAQEALLDAYGMDDSTENAGANLEEAAIARALRILTETGRKAQASLLIKRLEEKQISDPELARGLAAQRLQEGRFEDAFELLKQTVLDQKTKDQLNAVADGLEAVGRFDDAAGVLRYINENDFLLSEISRFHEKDLEISAEIELADWYFRNRRYARAFQKYVHILQQGHKEIDSIVERLEAILERGERVDGGNLIYLAEYFRDRMDYRRTTMLLRHCLDPRQGLANAPNQVGRVLDTLMNAPGRAPDIQLEIGILLLRIDRSKEAIGPLEAAAETPELSTASNRRLAEAYLNSGEYRQALERFRCVPISAPDLDALYALFERLEESGAADDAKIALRLIHGVNPNYRDVNSRLSRYEEERPSSAMDPPSASIPDTDPKMRELIGDMAIGRYKHVDKIGSGGMGVVYLVYDVKNQCNVAMKILREGLSSSNKAMMRFMREAQYADKMNHPNIVRIFDFNISNKPGQSFITMEYVDGPSLRQILEDRFQQTTEIDDEYTARIVFYTAQLCDALNAAHSNGIIHRDIKPDNIMVNSKGVVKITDFGILHVEDATYTPTGALLGTPRYMSPEQVRGGRIDNRADIYAVGILLYEMLTSSPPFISGDIAYQQVHLRPTSPREISKRVTSTLNQIIMTCLEKQPDRRYQNARNLKAALLEELREMGGHDLLENYHPEGSSMEDMDLDLD